LRLADRPLLPGATGVGPLAVDLALRLTLLDLLLRPVGDWMLRPLILGLAAIPLLRPRWLGQPLLWLALAGLTGTRAVLDWPLADNHAYLLAYWCLAASLALMARDADRALAFNGRLLIGLVFLFACIWKFALSGDYLDGTFFQVTLLTDPRFEANSWGSTGMRRRQSSAAVSTCRGASRPWRSRPQAGMCLSTPRWPSRSCGRWGAARAVCVMFFC
jgi:hypothetical protein